MVFLFLQTVLTIHRVSFCLFTQWRNERYPLRTPPGTTIGMLKHALSKLMDMKEKANALILKHSSRELEDEKLISSISFTGARDLLEVAVAGGKLSLS